MDPGVIGTDILYAAWLRNGGGSSCEKAALVWSRHEKHARHGIWSLRVLDAWVLIGIRRD